MDEKIKEIMSKCYVPVIERDGDNEYNMEKFAELIIKDMTRQPLSDTEIQKLYMEASLVDSGFVNHFARLVEAAHGIK